MSTSNRQLRQPVPGFERLPLVSRLVAPAKWYNLRWQMHANRADLFFVSASARLTPANGKVPCLYLAPSEKTSFLELYGDRVAGDREAGRIPRNEAADFLQRVYLQVDTPELLLADLTTGDSLEKLHLDLGTLYAADPNFPRGFAEAIFHHPAHVDGILYESRHSKELCAVIWSARKPALADVAFVATGNLGHRTTLAGAIATVFGQEVEVGS